MIDTYPSAGDEVLAQRRGDPCHRVLEIGEQRLMQLHLCRRAVVEHGVQVRRRLPGNHHSDRAEQRSPVTGDGRHRSTGRICHRAGAQQHQPVETAGRELDLQPRISLPSHPGQVGRARDRRPADSGCCRPILDDATSASSNA